MLCLSRVCQTLLVFAHITSHLCLNHSFIITHYVLSLFMHSSTVKYKYLFLPIKVLGGIAAICLLIQIMKISKKKNGQ